MSSRRKSCKSMARGEDHHTQYNLRSGATMKSDEKSNKNKKLKSHNSQVIKEDKIKDHGLREIQFGARRKSVRLSQLSQSQVEDMTCNKKSYDSKNNNPHKNNHTNSNGMAEVKTIETRAWRILEFKDVRRSKRLSQLSDEEEDEEDLSDEAFMKRHRKFELEEKRAYKRELQRLREEERVQHLKDQEAKRENKRLEKKVKTSRKRKSTRKL